MHMLCKQDTKVLEIFRLVLLTHVHLARLSRQKRAAQTKRAPPVFSEYVSERSPSRGWPVWGQGSQFFFLWPVICIFLFVLLLYENKFTETFMFTWQSHLELFQPDSHSANGFSEKSHFCTRLWSSKDTINEPPFFFFFTLKPRQTAANNISFVESLVTEGSEVSDIKNTISWVTRLCFEIMLYCHKLLIEHLSTCPKDLTHLNLCVGAIL